MSEPPPSTPPPQATGPAAPPAVSQPPPGVADAAAPGPTAAAAADADATQSYHFRRILGSTATIVLGGILVLGGFIGGSLAASPGIGVAVAGGAFLLVLLVVFALANSRAEADFFAAYAGARGLLLEDGRGRLPPVTPLLRKGDSRYSERTLRGTLPGGAPGTLALYTYEDRSTDSEGNTQTTYYHFTVALIELPEVAPHVTELYCQRRAGFRFLDSAEDVFRTRQRVETESELVDQRYEIFCAADDDQNTVREVLSPSFLVWLGEHSPEAFAFECIAGILACNVKGHKKSAGELDRFCEAASAVSRRLREEAAE